jgi:hypothetical protein
MAAFNSGAAVSTSKPTPDKQQSLAITKLTVKELQDHLGRKLTLREKAQFYLAKKLLRATDPEDEELAKKGRSNAYTGFGFGLAGILLFPLFAIPAVIISNNALAYDKEKPGILGDARGFAKAGQIMGWVGIGLLAVGVFFVLLFLAAWHR